MFKLVTADHIEGFSTMSDFKDYMNEQMELHEYDMTRVQVKTEEATLLIKTENSIWGVLYAMDEDAAEELYARDEEFNKEE